MNKKINILLVGLLAVSISLTIYTLMNQPKTGYFDYNEVYNNCKLKLRLEKDLVRVGNGRKSELDSLQLELTFLSQKIEAKQASAGELGNFEDLKNRFLTLQGRYEEENMRLKETYFNQITKEINDKARLFGAENHYDYLFSANGDGSLMYGADGENVTKAFQKYLD